MAQFDTEADEFVDEDELEAERPEEDFDDSFAFDQLDRSYEIRGFDDYGQDDFYDSDGYY